MSATTVTDQMGRQVQIPEHCSRIISLVPSQIELLFDLGLEDLIVGVTQFCIHPKEQVVHKTKIGGTKRFIFNKIAALQPDLIIGNKEENYQAGVERLCLDYPVWMSDIKNLEDAYVMICALGDILHVGERARQLVANIRNQFASCPMKSLKRAAYLIWRKPYMVAGGDTFINEMLGYAGFVNVFAHLPRYPQIGTALLSEVCPEYVLLSTEPYPFREKHLLEFTNLLPQAKILLIDGEMFSWYGSRLQYAPAYFKTLMKEEI